MEKLTPPNEVLALGIRLVHELELEPGVDTLSRWMAHHLAEVIQEADRTQGAEREAAQARAVDLILKLWERRHNLPGGAHPLKNFENVIAVLRRLQHDSWPFRRAVSDDLNQLLTDAFDGLQLLVAYGVLIASDSTLEEGATHEGSAFLDDEESIVLEAIQEWVEFSRSKWQADARILLVTEEDVAAEEAENARLAELEALDPKERSRREFATRLDELIDTLNALKAATTEAPLSGSGIA